MLYDTTLVVQNQMDDREIEATYDLAHQAAMSGIDADVGEDDWRDHPMFRTELPDDVDNHKHLSCFQTVLYEGETPESLALHFKELGNELYQSGRKNWKMAVHWWTKGLEQNMDNHALRSILHSNRASVSLGNQDYQKAALDANWAIREDPMNKRAYLRAAHAYQGMANWDKAIAAGRAGLEITPQSDPMHAQLETVVKTCSDETGAIELRVSGYLDSLKACDQFFKRSGVSVGKFAHTWMGNWDISIRFDEDKNEAIWPLVIAYDEVMQVDFVEGIAESTPIGELLAMIVPGANKGVAPPAWDGESRYTTNSIVAYVATHATTWQWGRQTRNRKTKNAEVSLDCSLRDLFVHEDYVVPGYPIIYLAVRDSKFAERLSLQPAWTPKK